MTTSLATATLSTESREFIARAVAAAKAPHITTKYFVIYQIDADCWLKHKVGQWSRNLLPACDCYVAPASNRVELASLIERVKADAADAIADYYNSPRKILPPVKESGKPERPRYEHSYHQQDGDYQDIADDLTADYVKVTTTGYNPARTTNTPLPNRVTASTGPALTQTDAYDKVEFVPSAFTVRTERTEERPDWNASVGDWLQGDAGSEVEGKYLSADPYKGNYDDAALAGYSHTGTGADASVHCWFCNESVSYREFALNNALEQDGTRRFVTEMLLHNAAHRSNNDTVWINSTIKNRGWAPRTFTFQPK